MQAVMPTLGWRWLLGLSSLPLAILLLFYAIVPESPRYLAAKGETTKAFTILQQMAKTNNKPLPPGRLIQPQPLLKEHHPNSHKTRPSSASGDMEMVEIARTTKAAPDEVQSSLLKEQEAGQRTSLEQVFSNFTSLVSPPLLSSTLLLWSVFFANAFTYYGLVLLTSQLSGGGDPNCRPEMVEEAAANLIPQSDTDGLYLNVFVSSIGGTLCHHLGVSVESASSLLYDGKDLCKT